MDLPQCLTTAVDDQWVVDVTTHTSCEVVVEIQRPDGRLVRHARFAQAEQTTSPLRFSAGSFAAGENRVTIYTVAPNETSVAQRFVVYAQTVRAGESDTSDADGDCFSRQLGDCDDGNASLRPYALEICNDGADNDCNGLVDAADAACAAVCPDFDGDGFGAASCGGGDCAETDASIHPGVEDVCDSIDNNCNGLVDEAFDSDLDGFISCPNGFVDIVRQKDGTPCPAGYAFCADCNDGNDSIKPGTTGECAQ